MNRHKKLLGSQSGAVSLVAVSLISVLILTIVIPMSNLMTGELRHAIDAESSIKSYYEAQSAADQATLYVKSYLRNTANTLGDLNQGCVRRTGDPSFFTPVGTSAITCIRIISEGDPPPMTLKPNETREFDLTGKDYDRIEFRWAPADTGTPGSGGEALIESTMLTYSQARDTSNSRVSAMVLDPGKTCPVSGDGCVPKPFWYGPVTIPGPRGPIVRNTPSSSDISYGVVRNPSNEFPISSQLERTYPPGYSAVPVGSPPSFNTVLRIRARNFGAKVKVTFYKGNTKVDAPLQYTRVDVTARVGDVYRRVQQDVPALASPFANLGEVIYADSDICKDLEIRTAPGFEEASYGICPVD